MAATGPGDDDSEDLLYPARVGPHCQHPLESVSCTASKLTCLVCGRMDITPVEICGHIAMGPDGNCLACLNPVPMPPPCQHEHTVILKHLALVTCRQCGVLSNPLHTEQHVVRHSSKAQQRSILSFDVGAKYLLRLERALCSLVCHRAMGGQASLFNFEMTARNMLRDSRIRGCAVLVVHDLDRDIYCTRLVSRSRTIPNLVKTVRAHVVYHVFAQEDFVPVRGVVGGEHSVQGHTRYHPLLPYSSTAGLRRRLSTLAGAS